MKIFFKAKDGGYESRVFGYWLFESKRFGSVVLLKFEKGSRDAYHTHAFHAISWILKGHMKEQLKDSSMLLDLRPSFKPLFTHRDRFHKVTGIAKSTWAISFRGPWVKTWKEFIPFLNKEITLTNGRKEIEDF